MSLPVLPYFHVDRLIAEGGTAKVYWGVDLRSGFPVAIKELKFNYLRHGDIVELFKKEANKYLYFTHPYMTKLVDFYDYKGRLYIMMEFVEGITLDKHLYEVSGLMPEEKAISMFIKILDVISYLHDNDVLHLDIKANNIMILPDCENIKLLDLGISVNMNGNNTTGHGFGTASYMPPEQSAKGGRLCRYTDIFALGVVLFEMLTGRQPFWGTTREETRRKIIYEPIPQVAQFYSHVNPAFQPIVERAMAKNPERRYQSCKEMKKDLLMIIG